MKWLKKLFGTRELTDAEQLLSTRDAFMASQEGTETPWAMFEVMGFEANGQIRVEFNWNDAFIKRINELGFQAETAEDAVQLFFYASQMKPTELSGGDDAVQADQTPHLSAPANRIVV
jgi:hypothetical protein